MREDTKVNIDKTKHKDASRRTKVEAVAELKRELAKAELEIKKLRKALNSDTHFNALGKEVVRLDQKLAESKLMMVEMAESLKKIAAEPDAEAVQGLFQARSLARKALSKYRKKWEGK